MKSQKKEKEKEEEKKRQEKQHEEIKSLLAQQIRAQNSSDAPDK
jgi:hypothetical protein